MSSSVAGDPVTEAVRALAAGVGAMLEMPLERRAPVEQPPVYAQVEELRRQFEFGQARLLRIMQDSAVPAVSGAPSMVALLQGLIRVSAKEAASRVRTAESLCDGRSLTGEMVPAPLPAVAAMARAGVIGNEHVQVIIKTLHRLPAELDPDIRARAEQTLTDNAETFDPRTLGRIGNHLLHRIAPKDPKPEDVARQRGLSFFDDMPGMTAIRGRCSNEAAEVIQSALDPLAKPLPEIDGVKDQRTGAQRSMDALEDLAARALQHGDLPTQGGERPHVNLNIRSGSASAELPWVGPVPFENVRWMLCDSIVTPIEIDENGVPRRIGDPARTVPGWLRRSVIARDRGCAFPGCDRPAAWSDIHHVIAWEDGGPHALGNLVVLCGHHHKLIHRERWRIDFIDQIPHFVPPRWIDPDQKPRRNHLHHAIANHPLRT